MDKPEERIRWGTEQRLEFIEFMAFWEGGVNRGDITRKFGVSVPQASNDLTLYQKLAPTNLLYDSSEKRYVPTAAFSPRFMKPSADRYLGELRAVAEQVVRLDETWIAQSIPVDTMPLPVRKIDPSLLKRLILAVRTTRSIEIYYQSMNAVRPDAVWRRITPHAFAHDGLRWHVRAYCHIDSKFKDFILSRCRDLRAEDAPGAAASEDHHWTSIFNVVLMPNPELTASQRETIAMDYDMTEGKAIMPIRCALLYYFEKRLRLDVGAKKDRPAERPIVVENWKEFVRSRDAAMRETAR